MQERQVRQFTRRKRPAPDRDKRWPAHGKQMFGAEPESFQALPIPVAMPDRDVHVFAGEIDMVHVGGNPERNLGMFMRKPSKPVHQKLGGEIRRDADRQRAGALPLAQQVGAERDAVQRVGHNAEIMTPYFRRHHVKFGPSGKSV
jgi:hypothetical protein